MVKPLVVDIPYPSMDCVKENRRAAYIISSSYAGYEGELNAILSYNYHSLYFESFGMKDYAETLTAISIAEMRHLDILGRLLIKLGADPVYTLRAFDKCDFYNTSNVSSSNIPVKMLLDDISGELTAINAYKEMEKKLPDDVAAIIARIRLDEELHVKALKSLMEKLSSRTVL
ncbi:MAG: hypothetical protein HP008_00615 [Clostridia bacterium]|nr:hypothetical protein [Clostridia bacterium]